MVGKRPGKSGEENSLQQVSGGGIMRNRAFLILVGGFIVSIWSKSVSASVDLARFAADSTYGIQIEWVTDSEVNNMGFDIYRSLDQGGEYTKANIEIIPGRGKSDIPCTYRFADDGATHYDSTYWYKLQDISLGGDSSWHGPISATLGNYSPSEVWLGGSTPNPYYIEIGGGIRFRYGVPQRSFRNLVVCDTTGDTVRILVEKVHGAGWFLALWDVKDEYGVQVPEGFYDYILSSGTGIDITKRLQVIGAAGVEEAQDTKILPFAKVYPNPFYTHIKIFDREGEIEIYDPSGRLIRRTNNDIWNGKDSSGEEVESGIYFLKARGYKPVKVVKLK
jgi:flagellar hook assembly protein FlgD